MHTETSNAAVPQAYQNDGSRGAQIDIPCIGGCGRTVSGPRRTTCAPCFILELLRVIEDDAAVNHIPIDPVHARHVALNARYWITDLGRTALNP